MGDIALRVFDHARQTYGDHETRVDVIDINGEMVKEGRALERLCITTVRALFTCPSLCYLFSISDGLIDGVHPAAPSVKFY